jgi:L-amino acid N-acyltransferase
MIRKFRTEDKDSVISILNYYVRHSFAAYPEDDIEYDQIKGLFELPDRYPFYILEAEGNIFGFGLLHPHLKMSTFSHTAEITCFILPEFTSKGWGGKILDRILNDARNMSFEVILASISSLNQVSINFHLKNGFEECGRFKKVGKKFNKSFDVVWMQRFIQS